MNTDRGRQLLTAIAETFQNEAISAVDMAAPDSAPMLKLRGKIEALTQEIEEDSRMTETQTGQPYTLESSDFAAQIEATATRAANDIASIETEIAALTAKFKADIQSRQARKADLQMIVTHGKATIEAIRKDSTNIVEAIEQGLVHALGDVGKELSDFGSMLTGNKAPAPQITGKTPEPAPDPAEPSITIK